MILNSGVSLVALDLKLKEIKFQVANYRLRFQKS